MNYFLPDALLMVVALILVLATLPGTLYLLVLTLAGMRRLPMHKLCAEQAEASWGEGRALAIVVPAHNEASGIARTVLNLRSIAQRDGAARVVVIADNCSDGTAEIARSFGATVLERQDATHRGKGYALDFAFRILAAEGFDGYVVVDADSVADANLLSVIRRHFSAGAQIVQARYTVLNAEQSSRTRLAELALLAFNCLRPRGRHALGLSAGILGNGFALRRSVIERVPYGAISVVEDLEYHLQLIGQGYRVHFADETTVRGEMPIATTGQATQRARWEGGRLRMLLDHGGSLLRRTLTGQFRFLEPLLDLLLLPLAYHALLLACLFLLPSTATKLLSLFGLMVLVGHVVVAAQVGGLSLAKLVVILAHVPRYCLWKLRTLGLTVHASRTATQWIRTDRDNSR